MTIKKLIFISITLIGLSANMAFAGNEGGGGDLECDAQIRKIAGVDTKSLEGSLYFWYSNNGPQKDSQLNLSSSKNPKTEKPYTKNELTSAMLDLMNKPLRSGCVHHQNGDRESHPIMIGGVPKVCRTITTDPYVDILCDSDLFLSMKTDKLSTADLQIQQINHEYAINVLGLEPDYSSIPDQKSHTLDISTYTISQQLSAITQTVQERKVMVIDPANNSSNSGLEEMKNAIALAFKNRFNCAGGYTVGGWQGRDEILAASRDIFFMALSSTEMSYDISFGQNVDGASFSIEPGLPTHITIVNTFRNLILTPLPNPQLGDERVEVTIVLLKTKKV